MPNGSTVDRRAALKARHRTAILDAARTLIAQRDGARFAVDELADAADVARRTIFNHFASLDDVLLAVCAEELAVIVDRFTETVAGTPVGDGSRSAMFTELAHAIDATDMPAAIHHIVTILQVDDSSDDRARWLAGTAFGRVGDLLHDEVFRRYRDADELDVRLLVTSLMSGLEVIAAHWVGMTGAALDVASRSRWDGLLDRLIMRMRSGYMPTD